MGDFCWSLHREHQSASHGRKAIQEALQRNEKGNIKNETYIIHRIIKYYVK